MRDIQNEVRVLSALQQEGGQENIITILDHGRNKFGYYFIDMDLCESTLSEYIEYHRGVQPCKIDPQKLSTLSPVFVQKDGALLDNLWTIGIHITRGLEFMHKKNYVHRDLKPGNSTFPKRMSLIKVLYSLRDNCWKLTDFGLSVEATSKLARTTYNSKGTSCYRAPELLREHATYTNKVDMWALGCVLHELATHRPAFHQDWNVLEYFSNPETVREISLPSLQPFWQTHLSGLLQLLLHRDREQRPRASELCQLFACYRHILTASSTLPLIELQSYPSFSRWRDIGSNSKGETDVLFWLAKACKGESDKAIAIILQQEWLRRVLKKGEQELRFESKEAITKLKGWGEDEIYGRSQWETIHLAAMNGNATEIRALVGVGADVTVLTGNWPRRTPLHFAAASGNIDAIEVLLDNGANILAEDALSYTPIHMAASNGQVNAIRLLAKRVGDMRANGLGDSLMHAAAKSNSVVAITALEQLGANVSALSRRGETPMHAAARNNAIDAITVLSIMGADVSSHGHFETPMHLASENNCVAAIFALKNLGASESARDKDGLTPMHRAAKSGAALAIRALHSIGADKSAKDPGGLTPMHWAAREGCSRAIRALEEIGADKTAVDNLGLTPKQWALAEITKRPLSDTLSSEMVTRDYESVLSSIIWPTTEPIETIMTTGDVGQPNVDDNKRKRKRD